MDIGMVEERSGAGVLGKVPRMRTALSAVML
jgi:hypothetical protein